MSKKIFTATSLATAFSIIPIIWFTYLPLHDYPNHLATLQIRQTLSSNSYLARFYEARWLFTPYLELDLLTTPLMYLASVEMAGRIVIALTFIMICIGTILLNRELNPNNWGCLSLFAGIFLYNGGLIGVSRITSSALHSQFGRFGFGFGIVQKLTVSGYSYLPSSEKSCA